MDERRDEYDNDVMLPTIEWFEGASYIPKPHILMSVCQMWGGLIG